MTTADLQALAQVVAKERGVDPDLVARLIEAESSWNPGAVSPKGAKGLMQLMPATAADMGVKDPLDPEQNIRGGVEYLARMLEQFDNPVKALAAYNFGPGNVSAGKAWPEETINYVDKILPDAAPKRAKPSFEQVTSDPDFKNFSSETQKQILHQLIGPEAVQQFHASQNIPSMSAGPGAGPEPSTKPEAFERIMEATGISSLMDKVLGSPKSVRPALPSPTPSVEEQPINDSDVAQFLRGLSTAALPMAGPAVSTPLRVLAPVLGAGTAGTLAGGEVGRAIGEKAGAPETGSVLGEALGGLFAGGLASKLLPKVNSAASMAQNLAKRVKSAVVGREAAAADVNLPEMIARSRMSLANRGPVRGEIPRPAAPEPAPAPPSPAVASERMALADRGPVRGRVQPPQPAETRIVKTPQEVQAEKASRVLEVTPGAPSAPAPREVKLVLPDGREIPLGTSETPLIQPAGDVSGESVPLRPRRRELSTEGDEGQAKDFLGMLRRSLSSASDPSQKVSAAVEEAAATLPEATAAARPPAAASKQLDAAAAPAYNKVERRVDLATRKKVTEMTPEEMQQALLSDEKTGLGNRRAFDESPRKPVQVMFDAEGLKWTNDNLGHDVGDELLKAVGTAIREEAGAGFRFSGDEFGIEADTAEQAHALATKVRDRLSQAKIKATLPDGTTKEYQGFGLHYGVGEHADASEALKVADQALNASKQAAVKAGTRAERGGAPAGLRTVEPAGVSPVTPQGNQAVGGVPAEAAATQVEEVVSKPPTPGLGRVKSLPNEWKDNWAGKIKHMSEIDQRRAADLVMKGPKRTPAETTELDQLRAVRDQALAVEPIAPSKKGKSVAEMIQGIKKFEAENPVAVDPNRAIRVTGVDRTGKTHTQTFLDGEDMELQIGDWERRYDIEDLSMENIPDSEAGKFDAPDKPSVTLEDVPEASRWTEAKKSRLLELSTKNLSNKNTPKEAAEYQILHEKFLNTPPEHFYAQPTAVPKGKKAPLAASGESPAAAPVQEAAAAEGGAKTVPAAVVEAPASKSGPSAKVGGKEYRVGEIISEGPHAGKMVIEIEDGIPVLSSGKKLTSRGKASASTAP